MTWPSSFPPGTSGYMIDRIDDEIVRSGTINTEIAVCINDAIAIYQKERMRFNETFTSTFQTIAGQQNYNVLSDINFPNVVSYQQIYAIDWMTITLGFAVFDVPRYQPEEILILTQTGTQMGQPYAYAFSDETIMLYPVPSAGGPGAIGALGPLVPGSGYTNGNYTNVPFTGGTGFGATGNFFVAGGMVQSLSLVNPGQGFVIGDILTSASLGPGLGFTVTVTSISTAQGPFTMTVGAHVTYAAPATTSTTGNRWFLDGERLIRSRAKYELATHVLNDADLAARMSPAEPVAGQLPGMSWVALKELRGETNKLTGRGVIRPMHF